MTPTILQILVLNVAAILVGGSEGRVQAPLGPTLHASLPRTESELWLVPSAGDQTAQSSAARALASAVRAYQAGDHAEALAALRRVERTSAVADYVEYYRGLAHLRLSQLPEARRTLDALVERKPHGALALAASLARGEVAEAERQHREAAAIYERLAADKGLVTEDILMSLGRAALAAGDRKQAAEAYLRVYYEFPLTDAATAAASRLADLESFIVRTGYKADLGRASMLFGARRYAEARSAFQAIHRDTRGDDRELVELRIAECDFYLKRYAAARDALRPHLDRASRRAEARFFYLSALRELGQSEQYVERTRALVAEFPDSSWSEEALNNLGTHYILENEDEAAARVFRELYEKFPAGPRAERAAWKAGWWSYKNGEYADTVRIFESAAAAFPRSDYRPSYLYWAARAHGRLGAGALAEARYRIVHQDYGNSYYGRLAARHVARRGATAAGEAVPASLQAEAAAAPRPPTADRIRLLLASGLYDDALAELRYAQRRWGTSPAIEATIAWAYHKKGELRRGITLMRRAYPQSLTSGGHELPVPIRQVIFPLVYWDLIRKHASAHKLDPYVVAALIAQESTFDRNARSVANPGA